MKACPSCGTRNEERSLFCNECGERLPGHAAGGSSGGAADDRLTPPSTSASGRPGPGAPPGMDLGPESTMVAEPATAPMERRSSPPAGEAGIPTPVAPPRVPTVPGTCATCGFRLPAGGGFRLCPGCGASIGGAPATAPVAGEHTRTVGIPPAAPAAAPVAAAQPAPDPAPPARIPVGWYLVLLKAGERLDRFALKREETILGRAEGEVTFPDDMLLSSRHARIVLREGRFWLEDAGSRNGVFLRLRDPAELTNGDVVTFGSLVFRYRAAPGTPRGTSVTTEGGVKSFGSGRERARGHLVRILQDGTDGPAYPLTPSKTVVGRKVGHLLFPDDPLLSRQHLQFYERDGKMVMEDLGSSNGSLLRIRGPVPLEKGTVFRVGDVTLEATAP